MREDVVDYVRCYVDCVNASTACCNKSNGLPVALRDMSLGGSFPCEFLLPSCASGKGQDRASRQARNHPKALILECECIKCNFIQVCL